jgi:hypothetical protein
VQTGQSGRVYSPIVSYQADGGSLAARHDPRFVAHLLDGCRDLLDFLFAGAVAHDYEHLSS